MASCTIPILIALPLLLLAPAAAQAPADPDRDGDGLSDFAEEHKYRTDPGRKDSDGDGIPDGDWRERREFTYTVRAVVQVMKPVTPAYLDDDYQDARVLDETADHVELEVILYPINSVGEAIAGDPQWRRKATALREWLEPGPTSDWTPGLRAELLAALQEQGIAAGRLDDKELVERASRWLCGHAKYHDGFSTFVTAFDADGRPFVPEELRGGVERGQLEKGLTLEQQWEREISAAGMFRNAVRGSCSSSAIYLSGCLRALGIPTRTVLCIPIVDANDDQELRLLKLGLTHRGIAPGVRRSVEKLRGSWASHTFNEVWVGGRWRRLNYDRLGQDIHDPGLFGLMIHVATFRDWADADMPATIGRRQKGDRPDDVFGGPNPYSTIALRDEFGPHCRLENPPLELPAGRITRFWWHDDPELRDDVRQWCQQREVFGLVVRVEGLCEGDALPDFLEHADLRVLLRAEGHPTLGTGFQPGCWWRDRDAGYALLVVPFGGADRRDLAAGVRYTFAPRNDGDARWVVADDLRVVRGEK